MPENIKEIESIIRKVIKNEFLDCKNKEKFNIEDNTCVELNLQIAKKIAEFAEEKGKEIKVPIVISIVDDGGNIILIHRMENSLLASIDLSLNKAYTAVSLKMPTDKLKDLCKPGEELYGIQHTNNRFVIFGGGIPFIYKGKVVGAIGISGGSVEEDICVCEYALKKVMTK
ncbi:MAG: heme-binding protein [Terrisporobacter othiniensis]|uniref:GlcG/HbpS family heme-binding protein n=1 Tax=Terrisporobacter othiniensis TaxID=1577792 RepID=UPI00290D74C8|nr:heme-binding protein [Terrisporobacter othiniensis]MDU6984436.1 heme-binding protein [Terrisporobacter othiniensis]